MSSQVKRPVRVGIIGLGFMGGMHAAAYRQMPSKVRLQALCDLEPGRTRKLDPEGSASHYRSLDMLLRDKDIDLVDICLPTHLHVRAAAKALTAGKHVVCEKPLARRAAQARGLAEMASHSEKKLMVAQVVRFWPEYQVLEKFVKERTLGPLRSLSLTRLSPRPEWSWENWLHQPGKSGGAILDLHIHDVDYVVHLLGRPRAISAQAVRGSEGGYDSVQAQFLYGGGLSVQMEGGWNYPASYPFRMAFSANFARGAMEYCSARHPRLTVYPDKGRPWYPKVPQVKAGQGQAKGNISSLGGYFLELEYFVDCLLQGSAPQRVTPASAAEAVEMVEWEVKAARTGKAVFPSVFQTAKTFSRLF